MEAGSAPVEFITVARNIILFLERNFIYLDEVKFYYLIEHSPSLEGWILA